MINTLWQHFALQALTAYCCRVLGMAQHHCVASVSFAHLSTASAAVQQPGRGAFHIAACFVPASLAG